MCYKIAYLILYSITGIAGNPQGELTEMLLW